MELEISLSDRWDRRVGSRFVRNQCLPAGYYELSGTTLNAVNSHTNSYD